MLKCKTTGSSGVFREKKDKFLGIRFVRVPVNLFSETPLYKRKAKLSAEQKERRVKPNTYARTTKFI
jgi:TfoX/Sxy family transcriptional regulator of competence genes